MIESQIGKYKNFLKTLKHCMALGADQGLGKTPSRHLDLTEEEKEKKLNARNFSEGEVTGGCGKKAGRLPFSVGKNI